MTLIPDSGSGSYAEVSTVDLRVSIELGGLPQSGRFHALVAWGEPTDQVTADLLIAGDEATPARSARNLLEVEQGRRVTLRIEEQRISVTGGRRVSTPSG
jgi:hypothetical protein